MATNRKDDDRDLLGLRGAIIFTLAFVIGLCAGALDLAAHRSTPEAVAAGGAAFGGAVVLLNAIVSRR